MDKQRQKLDELFGKDRDLPLKERFERKEHYDDLDVCKYNLVSFCPHDLFPNTKNDLGECTKRHDDFFKRMFEMDLERLPYERRYLNETISLIYSFSGLIESQLATVDSKIKRSQSKLDDPIILEKPKEIVEKISQYDIEIKRLLAQVERLGDEGKIDESERLCFEIEQMKAKKEDLMKMSETNLSMNKMMKVCEICGALQAIQDTEKRMQTHLEGKLHTGFALLRKELEVLKRRREDIRILEALQARDKKERRERVRSPSNGIKESKKSHSQERKKKHRKSEEKKRKRSHSHKKKKHR